MTELNWVFWAWSANFSNEFASLYLSWISQSSELNIQRENIIGKKKIILNNNFQTENYLEIHW